MADFTARLCYVEFDLLDGTPDTSMRVSAHLVLDAAANRRRGVVADRPLLAVAPVDFSQDGNRPGVYSARLIPSAQIPGSRYRLDAAGDSGLVSYFFAMPDRTVTADQFAALVTGTQ